MMVNRKRMMRRVFVMAGIIFSFLSVAILHAYAGNDSEETVLPKTAAGYHGSATVSGAIQTISYTTKPAKPIHTVDVCPGDTLLDIAAANMPEGENVRSYMYKIKKLNKLKNSSIQAGQILILP